MGPFGWPGRSFHGLQRDLCPLRNVGWPLRRSYILLPASLPEGSHGCQSLLNWMTGQNHTNTRNPHCLPENKGCGGNSCLKMGVTISAKNKSLSNSYWKWTPWRFYSHILITAALEAHRSSLKCVMLWMDMVHFITYGRCFVVFGHCRHACRCTTWISRNLRLGINYRSSGIQLGAGMALSLPIKGRVSSSISLATDLLYLPDICWCSEEMNSGKRGFYQYFQKGISKGTKKALCPASWWYFPTSVEIIIVALLALCKGRKARVRLA